MNEGKIFDQICKNIQERKFDKAKSFIITLFDHISVEEFFCKFDKDDIEKLAIAFKDNSVRFDGLINGFVNFSLNNQKAALRDLKNEKEVVPNHYLAYHLSSFIDFEVNDKCLEDAKEAVILNPTERSYVSLGNRYFEYCIRRENHLSPVFSRAILCYQNSIRLNGDYTLARLQKARVLNFLNKFDLAYQELMGCIEISPTESVFYLEISRTLSHLTYNTKDSDRIDKALNYLKKGLKLNQDSSIFHFELGEIFSEADNLEQAIVHYEKYLEEIGFSSEKEFEGKKHSERFRVNNKTSSYSLMSNDFYHPKNVLLKLKWMKEEKVLEDANKLMEGGKFTQALKIYEDLVKPYLNFDDFFGNEDLKLHSKYFMCKVLNKNKSFELDNNHPTYKWLVEDKDASEYRRKIREFHSDAEVMGIYRSGFEEHTKFTFGKYKNVDLKKVIEKDLSYISWCYFNIPSFIIVDLIRIDDRLSALNNYYKLLEIHLFKINYLLDDFEYEEEDYKTEYISLGDALGRGEARTAFWNTH